MLTFELQNADSSRPELMVLADSEGLASLLAQLAFLKDGKTDHVHLMSEAWGGTALGEAPSQSGATIIHHVKICLAK